MTSFRGEDAPLPYLTAELPGIGGVIKQAPEDFRVEEIPLYEPGGAGEHLFLWIQKRDISAESLVQHVARTLKIVRAEVGMAGLKDRRAVTLQYVSVPGRCEDDVAELNTDAVQLVHARRHGNKLKTGHLRGNRFNIVVRNTREGAEQHIDAITESLRRSGFPNYYGDQRFGYAGETLALGLDLLTGRKVEHDIPRSRRKFLVRLALSAVQSAIFNQVLADRVRDGLLERVLPGDVMQVRASGGPFVAMDLPREQERFEAGETMISGPIYGIKMRQPTGEPAERELAVLNRFGLTPAHFARWRKLLPGTRRPMIAFAKDLAVSFDSSGIRFQFELPRGTYATSLLREFQKSTEHSAELEEIVELE